MSRHLQASSSTNLTDIVMIVDAPATAGPFDEQEDDYVVSSDMLAAGRAGFEGVLLVDRPSVVDAVPLNLTLTVYGIAAAANEVVATPLAGVQVYLWHTDAAGVYSAVDGIRQPQEDTSGQKWSRNIQTSDGAGVVQFQTLLAGWYRGRGIHYHIRFVLPGSTAFVGTSQLFIADADLATYREIEPYLSNTQPVTLLSSDGIYRNLETKIREALTLNLVPASAEDGTTAGYTASMSIGLAYENVADATDDAPTKAPISMPSDTTTAPQSTAIPLPSSSAAPLARMGPFISIVRMLLTFLVKWL